MMNFLRGFTVSLLAASFTFAEVAPATQPTTAPAAAQNAVAPKKYPNVGELLAMKKAEQEAAQAKAQVAMFEFSSPLVEKPADFSWFGTDAAPTLRSVILRLHRARDDGSLKAVFLNFRIGATVTLAQAMDLQQAVKEIRESGKRVYVYADSFDTGLYLVASAASDICMLEGGELMMPGVGLETMFYKGAMDKVGITPDFVQIGEYKGAEEPYTRTAPSDELRGELNKLVASLFGLTVDNLAATRGLSRDTIRNAIDQMLLPGPVAKERGLVDHLVDQDGLRALMEGHLENDVHFIENYGVGNKEAIDFSNVFSLLKAMNKKSEPTRGPTVALIYAQGTIVDGTGEGSLFDAGGVGSETMREAFRTAAGDDNVKAIVIRIDSPGGSALASEVMWQAARRLAKEKPVIISIGGMAARGRDDVASAGDYIFADPAAIIGSIGVVGGKFVLKDLYDKLGLTTEEFSKGANAGLYSTSKVWDEKQRSLVRKSMALVYDQFTDRVMTTRAGKIADIDQVARGRIFLAPEAKSLGMVDELGGLERAIAHAASKASLESDKYEILTLPAPKTLADLIEGSRTELASPVRVNVQLSAESILLALPPSARKHVAQQMQFMRLLEKRAVVLMTPFSIQMR